MGTLAEWISSAPGLHLRPRLRVAGFTDEEVRRRVDAGDLHPCAGASTSAEPCPTTPQRTICCWYGAALGHLTGPAVVSHVSAAVLHGLPLWAVRLDRVDVTRDQGSGGAAVSGSTPAPLSRRPVLQWEVRTTGGRACRVDVG